VPSLFLSHSAADRPAAHEVHEWLRNAGYQSVFLDFDPSDGIPLGRRWEAELYSQLRRTDGVVFLASAISVHSKWCFAEICLARSMGRPVFPLRLDAAAALEVIQDVQWTDLTAGEAGFVQLRNALRVAGLDPDDSFSWDVSRSPFPGLESFGRQDAAVFFGRDLEIDRLLELLTSTLVRGSGRFVAIVGPSGSGKSSLVRAGLIPRIEKRAHRWTVIPPMRPGREPLRNLARAVETAFRSVGRERADVLAELSRGPESFVELCQELADAEGIGDRSVLLVLDQAEELVTRSEREVTDQFLGLLRCALHEESPLWAVATLRAEFLSSAPDRAALGEVIDDTMLVEPLSKARLPEIVERPAQRAGLDFEAGLVQRMVEDATGGDALPLLAWTLQQLYDGATSGSGRVVTIEAYEALGGVIGSVKRQADRLRAELDRRGEGELVLPTLLKLVNVDEAGEPTRRRVDRGSLSAAEDAVVQTFVDARLLTSNRQGQETVVEVAHEALLRQWPPLREAIAKAQEGLRVRSQVESEAEEWERSGCDPSYLLTGTRLAALEAWVDMNPGALGVSERQFLDASQQRARQEQAIQAEGWGRSALEELGRLPEKAVLLALKALATDRDFRVPAVVSSVNAVLDAVLLRHILRMHQDRLAAIAFSPDGEAVLTGSYDATARLWDVRTGKQSGVLTGHTDHVVCVAWSPDGSLLATGSWDGTARIWSLATNDCVATLAGHEGWVSSVSWSPDGTRLATGSRDTTAAVWDAQSAQLTRKLVGHSDWVRSAEWSPDGRRLLTGSYDGTAAVWDVETGRQLNQLRGHAEAVPAVQWLPDGQRAITASEDGTLRVWQVGSDKSGESRVIHVHTSPTYCLHVDATGSRVVTGSEDGVVRIFDLASGGLDRMLPGHGSWVSSVRWSPDNDWIASSSGDRTARLTYLPGRRRFRILDRAGGWISSVRWNPDGERVVRASGDGTLRAWHLVGQEGPTEAWSFAGANVLCVDWDGDGVLLVTGGYAGQVRVLDTDRREFVGDYPSHQDRVSAISVQPHGSFFATASSDGTAMVVNMADASIVKRFVGNQPFESVRWSHCGDVLALGSWDNDVYLWHVGQSDEGLETRSGHTAALHDVAWCPNGDRFVSTSGDGTARVWSLADKKEIAQMACGEAFAVGWSPDGRFIATGSRDGILRIWDTATAALLEELRHPEGIYSLDWSHDSDRLLSGGEDGTVWVWKAGLNAGNVKDELTELAAGVLTENDVQRLIPEWPEL
jgi:WD40 repeat protein